MTVEDALRILSFVRPEETTTSTSDGDADDDDLGGLDIVLDIVLPVIGSYGY